MGRWLPRNHDNKTWKEEAVRKVFDEVNKEASYASLAIRYTASLEGIITVLSGMSNMEQMKVLETELNVKLFSRKGRSFALTPAGEYFYQQSKSILEQIEGIRRETIRLGEDPESELQLNIGYVSCYSGQELLI